MAEGNWRLTSAMDESGMSNKGLAKRVEVLSAQEGRPVRCSHTDIRRWCDGMVPRERYKADLVARIVSAKLGRRVSAEQLGLSTAPAAAPVVADRMPLGWRVIRTRGHLALLQASAELAGAVA